MATRVARKRFHPYSYEFTLGVRESTRVSYLRKLVQWMLNSQS